MLAPDIFTTENQLTSLFNEVVNVSAYSISVQDTSIGKLPIEPSWIASVKSEMKLLSSAGASWIENYPDIWAPILLNFIDYNTSFAAFSGSMSKNKGNLTPEMAVQFLTPLSKALQNCAAITQGKLQDLEEYENGFSNVFPSINVSIQQGWDELKEEEDQMIAIAEAIVQLQDEISALQSQINSDAISNGKTFVQTNVKIAYDILTATGEVAVPYLSILTLAYTIGKEFYDIITDTEKINEDLAKIGNLQIQASEEAQAAAGTKAVIQYLYNIEIRFLTLKKHGNDILTMWQNEKSKVDEAIDAINAGADPNNFLEIMTMPIAGKNWDALQTYAQKIIEFKPVTGKEVFLNTSNN